MPPKLVATAWSTPRLAHLAATGPGGPRARGGPEHAAGRRRPALPVPALARRPPARRLERRRVELAGRAVPSGNRIVSSARQLAVGRGHSRPFGRAEDSPGGWRTHGPPLRGSTPSRNRPRSSGSRSTTADPHHRAQSRRFRSSRPPQPQGSERPHRQDRQHPCVDAVGASPGWAQPPLGPPPPDPKRGKEPKNNSAPATTLGCAFPGRALHLSRLAGVGQRRERDGVWN